MLRFKGLYVKIDTIVVECVRHALVQQLLHKGHNVLRDMFRNARHHVWSQTMQGIQVLRKQVLHETVQRRWIIVVVATGLYYLVIHVGNIHNE